MRKTLFLLLLPLFLFADVKFAVCASADERAKEFANKASEIIEAELGVTLIRNFESRIYEDETALYALKNGLIRFTVVKKELFGELGLDFEDMYSYGFELLSQKDGYLLLTQNRFFGQFETHKKAKLLKRLKNL